MLARGAVAGLLATAGLGLTVVTGGLAAASADPVLPVDPAIPVSAPADPAAPAPVDPAAPPPADPAAAPAAAAAPQSMLGQFAQATQVNPLATMKGLIDSSPQPAMIGMAPLPPETDTSYVAPPGRDPLSLAEQLKPQSYRMPTADQVSPYALSPNDNPSPFARVNAFKGVHALTHSNLGRMPGSELGQALPGTAPLPGSNIPAGLEQFYVDPAAAPPEAPAVPPPADPLLLPLVPPPADPLLLPAVPPPADPLLLPLVAPPTDPLLLPAVAPPTDPLMLPAVPPS